MQLDGSEGNAQCDRRRSSARWRGCSARCEEKPSVEMLADRAICAGRRRDSLQAEVGGLEDLRGSSHVTSPVSRSESREGGSVGMAQRCPEAPGRSGRKQIGSRKLFHSLHVACLHSLFTEQSGVGSPCVLRGHRSNQMIDPSESDTRSKSRGRESPGTLYSSWSTHL